MTHAVIVLVGRVVCAHLVEAVTACELFDFLFLHAVAAHSFLALDAEVHLIADEQA